MEGGGRRRDSRVVGFSPCHQYGGFDFGFGGWGSWRWEHFGKCF